MSVEGWLILAAIFIAVGAVSFIWGEKELPVRTGIVTKIVFPKWGSRYKGKLTAFGIRHSAFGFWLAALLLVWEVRPWH